MTLFRSAFSADLRQVEAHIREGAKVDTVLDSGMTPLVAAVQGNHIAVVKLLVHEGKADINKPSLNGTTPLMQACLLGDSIDLVQYFVEERGALIDSTDAAGNTALFYAAKAGCVLATLPAPVTPHPQSCNRPSPSPLLALSRESPLSRPSPPPPPLLPLPALQKSARGGAAPAAGIAGQSPEQARHDRAHGTTHRVIACVALFSYSSLSLSFDKSGYPSMVTSSLLTPTLSLSVVCSPLLTRRRRSLCRTASSP